MLEFVIGIIIVRYKLISHNEKFEIWLHKIDKESRQAPGFLDKTALPVTPIEPYYSVILRFDSKDNAEKWLDSIKRKSLLEELYDTVDVHQEMLYENNTFWFGRGLEKAPVKWKQVVVSFLAVYPLTQIVPLLVHCILSSVGVDSKVVSGIVTGIIISSCMVYFVMNTVLELFKNWLKPNSRENIEIKVKL